VRQAATLSRVAVFCGFGRHRTVFHPTVHVIRTPLRRSASASRIVLSLPTLIFDVQTLGHLFFNLYAILTHAEWTFDRT